MLADRHRASTVDGRRPKLLRQKRPSNERAGVPERICAPGKPKDTLRTPLIDG
jgi:hypothetical protein